MLRSVLLLLVLAVAACSGERGTEPPPDGWANVEPTRVEQVLDRGDKQMLEVSQGELRAWISVPAVGASVGDYVLLGRGDARRDVEVPELGRAVAAVVDIEHVRVVDEDQARSVSQAAVPDDAIAIGRVYDELDDHEGREVVVSGTVVKAPEAIGWRWVHLQDGSGDAASGTHDLTVKTHDPVVVGQRVAFRGVLRQDVDLGFGYHYRALVEDGARIVD
ncbi:MAG: hypothetical protein AAGA54_22980 [Myxococcota bacterium]